jgi:Lipase (class 3)
MATLIDYALMAGASYIDTRQNINKFPIPSYWVIAPNSHLADTATGFEAAAFGNGADLTSSSEIVISFAGTYDNPLNPITNPDLQADIGLATGFGSDQLTQAVDYYLQVKATNPNVAITLTGHSLGGGLASLVGVFFGVPATTFDQAPFANSALASGVAANLKAHLLAETFVADAPDVAAAKAAARDVFAPTPF